MTESNHRFRAVTPRRKTPRQLLLPGSLAVLSFTALIYAFFGGIEPWPLSAEQAGQITLSSAGALFAVAMSALWHLYRKRKSLSEFEDASRRVLNRDYASRLEVDVRDDLYTLAKVFNELTDQLDESLETRRSLTDIDSLILSGADITAIIRRSLNAARLEAVETRLLLRPDMSSTRVQLHNLDGQRVETEVVTELDTTDDALREIDQYRELAARQCTNHDMMECYPIACDEQLAGVLFASGNRTLTATESKRLADLVDRLSVAVTNIRRSETLYRQAHFDALTGLVNRRAFEDRLKESLARAHLDEEGVLLFIDLDRFKKVNDMEGHEAGDRLLVIVAERLREVMRPEDTIARLGGDEFAIIASGFSDEESIARLCKRIIGSLTTPVIVDRLEHSIGASIGVARYPEDGMELDEVVMKADSAMYRAKEKGGSRFDFFDDSLKEANNHRILVETRLRSAIKQNQLQLHFQPKLNLKNWTVNSAEALLRWRDEKLGDVDPAMFVGIAEETGLIHEIMPILVDSATELLVNAEAKGVKIENIALNASPKQIMMEGFALSVLSQLDYRDTPHEKIEIEVTENVFAQDMAQVLSELHILRMAGIRVALDDFGTGYSSLNMLRELPLDVVKIDRSFITELESSDQARSMVKHLIDISGALGLQVVAEGVETDLQLQHLIDSECDYIQGWIVSRALPSDEFLDTMIKWQSPHYLQQRIGLAPDQLRRSASQ